MSRERESWERGVVHATKLTPSDRTTERIQHAQKSLWFPITLFIIQQIALNRRIVFPFIFNLQSFHLLLILFPHPFLSRDWIVMFIYPTKWRINNRQLFFSTSISHHFEPMLRVTTGSDGVARDEQRPARTLLPLGDGSIGHCVFFFRTPAIISREKETTETERVNTNQRQFALGCTRRLRLV